MPKTGVEAVIFDLDGLLVDSEVYWEQARHDFCREIGCDWTAGDELGVKGANSREWAHAIQHRCDTGRDEAVVIAGVVAHMDTLYARHLPLLPGAVEVVRTLAERYPLAVASSSPLALIGDVLDRASLRDYFSAVVSADEVGRGKPNPDVFLEAARRLRVAVDRTAIFEDSSAGIEAAHAAGAAVIAVPNAHYPPRPEALAHADLVLNSLLDFDPNWLSGG